MSAQIDNLPRKQREFQQREQLILDTAQHMLHQHGYAQLTMERVNDEIASHGVGNTSAMLKYYGTELNKRRHELLMALQGFTALKWHDQSEAQIWLRSKGNSIEAGTSEIQLNIISKRILELG